MAAKGQPHTLSIGYQPTTGTWSDGSPAACLIEAAERGAPQAAGCEYAGNVPRTLQLWRVTHDALDPGADHQDDALRLIRFFRQFDAARSRVKIDLIGSWADAGRSDWRAAQAFLARRYPSEWGDPARRIEVSGPGAGPVEIELTPVAEIMASAAERARSDH